MATAPTPADAKRGPYTAAFGAIHHEDAPGFLFTVAPESAAEGVADAMNRAYAAEQAAKARPTEGELAEAAERLRYQVENHTSFSSEQEADISKLLAAAEAGRDPWPAGITEVRVGPDATNANCRRVIVNGAQWCKVYGMDGASVEARAEIIADALRLSGAAAGGDRLKEALLQAMRDELEKRTLEEAARIFGGGFAEGGPVRFEDRDFGRWNHKADARARPEHHNCRSSGWTHFELPPEFLAEAPDVFQYPGGEMFTTRRPKPSLFLSRAYLAVSEEPEVAVAAAQLRGALAAESFAVQRAPSGIETHSDAAVLAVVAAEAKLRRRLKRALLATTPRPNAAEHGLW